MLRFRFLPTGLAALLVLALILPLPASDVKTDPLPLQTGNASKFLQTNGVVASWQALPPSVSLCTDHTLGFSGTDWVLDGVHTAMAASNTQTLVMASAVPVHTHFNYVSVNSQTAFAGANLLTATISVGGCLTGNCPGGNNYTFYSGAVNLMAAAADPPLWHEFSVDAYKHLVTHDVVLKLDGTFGGGTNFSTCGINAGVYRIEMCSFKTLY